MAAFGITTKKHWKMRYPKKGYLLVIEGAIPLAEDGLYCTIGGRPSRICQGIRKKCSCNYLCRFMCLLRRFSCRRPTDAVGYLYQGTNKHHEFDDVTGDKPVVNLPTCPMHPERLVAIIVNYLTFGTNSRTG
jgi:hydrogenase small subunit